jgi:hypothetical protein
MAVVNHFQNPMNFPDPDPDPDPDCPKKALDQRQNMAAGSGVVGAGEADLELRKIGGSI